MPEVKLVKRRTSVRILEARRRRLEPWFQSNEVIELMKMPLYRLREYYILPGRRNEVKHAMRERGLTQREAVEWVYRNEYRRRQYDVTITDYINYYKYDELERIRKLR